MHSETRASVLRVRIRRAISHKALQHPVSAQTQNPAAQAWDACRSILVTLAEIRIGTSLALPGRQRAGSSVAERIVYIDEAGGSIPSPAHHRRNRVAYQISALFRDGALLLTEIQWGTTPEIGETISVLRDGVSVWGTVVARRRKKLVFSRAHDRIVDEVQFYEACRFEMTRPPVSKTRRMLRA